jgi:hypothetical protein
MKYSETASMILQENEDLRKPARLLAVHVFPGQPDKVGAFWDSMLKHGLVNGIKLTLVSYYSGNRVNLVFVGDEASVIKTLQNIKTEHKRVPETIAVKMLTARLMKIIEGISDWNRRERKGEKEALAQMALVPRPAWATPYTPDILPELELSDLPDCSRYRRQPSTKSKAEPWQYKGDGKAIIDLQKLWRRLEVTKEMAEAAWEMIEINKVMTG